MFKRILVPMDGSTSAGEALLAAGLLAEHEDAGLVVAHVEPLSRWTRADAVADDERIQREVEDLRWRGVRATYCVERGKPEESIAAIACGQNADLIVMAPHHRHLLEALRHPSVTARTFSLAAAPVLIWPEGLPGETFRGFLHLPNAAVFVPLDGSSEAERALPLAIAFAREYGRALLLVRVLTPVPFTGAGMPYSIDAQSQVEDEREARQYLGTLRRRLSAETGLTVQTMLLGGDAPRALARELEAHEGSLVVMTTHGRGAVARALVGSVATSLMRLTPVPLLVVPPAATLPVPGELEERRPVGAVTP
jgi:nucleotide-binding universal stress UspA family protein